MAKRAKQRTWERMTNKDSDTSGRKSGSLSLSGWCPLTRVSQPLAKPGKWDVVANVFLYGLLAPRLHGCAAVLGLVVRGPP